LWLEIVEEMGYVVGVGHRWRRQTVSHHNTSSATFYCHSQMYSCQVMRGGEHIPFYTYTGCVLCDILSTKDVSTLQFDYLGEMLLPQTCYNPLYVAMILHVALLTVLLATVSTDRDSISMWEGVNAPSYIEKPYPFLQHMPKSCIQNSMFIWEKLGPIWLNCKSTADNFILLCCC